MKTKSLVLALAAVALVAVLSPSEAQAGGGRNYGYNTYRGGCYSPVVVRPIRVVRPVRVVRAPAVFVRTPLISVGFGFGGGGRCRY